MNAEQFNQIAENRIEHCRKTLLFKGAEYSRDGDRMHNFRTAAVIDNETPERALWGMLKKHIVSVRDMVADVDQGKLLAAALIDEKITDWINYGLLLEGLLQERIGSAVQVRDERTVGGAIRSRVTDHDDGLSVVLENTLGALCRGDRR